ncbi:MAG: hypothetical protein H6766_03110 [Candidatus Peribacteria bacterium]|nr:MAG: hypothetical protein H6766_03110 [Candidatus Peribacteria bacterium]
MGADAADFILGPAGTTVQLTIRRGDKTIRVSIIRQQITIQMVSDRVLENGDYYIALTNFGYGSAADIVDALQRYTDSRATDLIIDLRHNPGGSVGELEAMLDVFLPTNSKAFTLRGEGYDYTYTTKKSSLILPLSSDIILLVDSGSASAAEMLALVLQDYGIATLVGETTFGKGTAQSIIDYDDGSSFKYTVYERFSSRSNTSINHQGVKPDYTITLDENYDNQLEYAKKL